MTQLEHRQSIFNLLQDFRGLSPLKDMFWSELNYERVNQSLSRRGWTDTASKALVENPVLIAAGGNDEDFHVIYARLASDRLLLGQERPVVSRLLREHPYALFVFSNEPQDRWHFVNVKYDDKTDKRRFFRRITIGPEERLRTATERLALLDLESVGPDLFGLSPLAIQERHDEAFDVESVQKDFFKVFANLYHKVVDDLAKVRGLEKDAGRLAQLLLDRMLFLYFIQKKGWLNQEPDYLYSRFRECWRNDRRGYSYYSKVLYPLFLCLSDSDTKMDGVGAVPFLNGGLFEESSRQTQAERLAETQLKIRNSTFKAAFDNLLERFNFTVTEDTPLDVEVAIDPEMLGKIFESLILQLERDPEKELRKLTGSYYTPRPIVHFMCQDALKVYLGTQLAGNDAAKGEIAKDKAGRLLALPPADQLDDGQVKTLLELFTNAEAKTLRQAILDCRVCDPAVGSGAFPVGMLHEMVAAVARLDLRLHGRDILEKRNYSYDVKKQVIESCLYGVDIQEQAVRLCELRLWLSLVVDYQIDPSKSFVEAIRDVPSLPNLSYRIIRGDSLLERLFGHVVQLDQMAKDAKTKQFIESIQADKHAYFREERTAEKRRMELKILAKQANLAERLIEVKHASMLGYQASLFGDQGMTVKQRKAKAEHETQVAQLTDLKTRVAKATAKIERLSQQKGIAARRNQYTLRKQLFQTGSHPTFMWRVDFAEVFVEKSGFDIVIGNPPYKFARSGGFSASEKPFFYAQYKLSVYQLNTYLMFSELSHNLLAQYGNVALIIPNTWLTIESCEKFRRFLITFTGELTIVDIEDKVFEEANVENVLLFFSRRRSSGSVTQMRMCEGDIVASVKQSCKDILDNVGANISLAAGRSDNANRLVRKISEQSLLLGNLCAVKSGLKAYEVGKGSPPQTRQMKDSRCYHSTMKKGNSYVRYLDGRDVSRYELKWSGKYLRYGKCLAAPRKPTLFKGPRILVRQIPAKPPYCIHAVYTEEHYLNDINSHIVLPNPESQVNLRYILGVLNSKLMSFWFVMSLNKAQRRLFPQFKARDLKQFPTKIGSRKQQQQLISLVSDMLDGSRSKTLGSDLDNTVYNIYGLKSDEIRTVETRA